MHASAFAQNGGHIVSENNLYGSYNLLSTLPNPRITASFVDIHDLEAVERAITEQTKALYIETLGNPNCDIPDMDALAELAHKYQIPLVVDTFERQIDSGDRTWSGYCRTFCHKVYRRARNNTWRRYR